MDNNELVICQGLTKNYGKKTALNNLNLTLGRGQFIGLLGPNGSGKTTTIKLLNGLLQPTSGSVLIDGQTPGTYTHSIISYLPDKKLSQRCDEGQRPDFVLCGFLHGF